MVELLAAATGPVGSRLGRWFAFVLLACAVVGSAGSNWPGGARRRLR
jgi:NADPH-dependent curcumin reductase CurA